MIIQDFVRKGNKLIVKTSDGEYSVNIDFDINLNKYKGLEINSIEDFSKIKNEFFESLILGLINVPWRFLNSNVKSLPRPLNVVYSKSQNIKEFLVMSFDTNNVIKAWLANQEVKKRLNKRVNENYSDEEILIVLQDIVEKVSKEFGFTLRMGVNISASRLYKDFEYVYSDRVLNSEEQYDYVTNLIDRFNLCYVEEPFLRKDNKNYKRLVEAAKHLAFICPGNGLVSETLALSELIKKLDVTKILVYKNRLSVHIAVGLGINIIKIGLNNEDCVIELDSIIHQMKKR